MHSCISSLENAQMRLVLLGLVSSARAASVERRCLLELHVGFLLRNDGARKNTKKKLLSMLIQIHHETQIYARAPTPEYFWMTWGLFRPDSIPTRVGAGAAGTKASMLLYARGATCGTQSRGRARMRTSRRSSMNPKKILAELRS